MELERKVVTLNISEKDGSFSYDSGIEEALATAHREAEQLQETIDTVSLFKPNCDKLDYALAASSGAICGLIDVFIVGVPSSYIGNFTDEWCKKSVMSFAKKCGYSPRTGSPSIGNAISWLENHFKVPYDQTSFVDEAAQEVYRLNTYNHHFKSLAHNPTLMGLFFSILDQFTNTSHFVTESQLLEWNKDQSLKLVGAGNGFELSGKNLPAKIWAGVVNWFGLLMSDLCGSSGSVARGSRGMGIPSPLWTWCNDLTVILEKLGIHNHAFIDQVNDFSLLLFEKGRYDIRFQTTQAIPVIINELLVRLIYSIRRGFCYYQNTPKNDRSVIGMFNYCKPFSNYSVKRMLTIAHGTFCLIDIGDATIRSFIKGGGHFNPVEFFMRFNLVGGIRFTISLYGEGKRVYKLHKAEKAADFAEHELIITRNYIEGLLILQKSYDDKEYLTFVSDISNNEYMKAFAKTSALAEQRKVPADKILKTKADIDKYFQPK